MAREQALRKADQPADVAAPEPDPDRDHIQALQRRLAEEEAQQEMEEAARRAQKGKSSLGRLFRRH